MRLKACLDSDFPCKSCWASLSASLQIQIKRVNQLRFQYVLQDMLQICVEMNASMESQTGIHGVLMLETFATSSL